jgi:MerR family transcriptional regulator, light-induced transcriptional regulator
MTDWNEHSHPTHFSPDIAEPRTASIRPVIMAPPVPEPIWRSTPRLKALGIARTLHDHILPKLAHALRAMPVSSAPDRTGTPLEYRQFTALALDRDEDAALTYAETLTAQGTSTELIFLNLLAPAARLLGEMWQDDAIGFADVTLAVSRLQRILRQFGETSTERRSAGGAVLLTTMSGEQHGFGMAMVAEFFRHDGWDVCCRPFASDRELLGQVAETWFDVVGVSVASDRRLDELRRTLQGVRSQSRNHAVSIMVGGPVIISRPELVNWLGADTGSVDGSDAPRAARRLRSVTAPR